MAKKFTLELTVEELDNIINMLYDQYDKLEEFGDINARNKVKNLIHNLNNQYFKQWNYKAQKGTK